MNGVSAEGLAASLDAMCALGVGLGIGFYYSWKETLVALACTPFMILGGTMNIKF